MSPLMDLMLAGDLMLGRGVNEMIRREGLNYPLGALYEVFRQADGVFANLECALATPGLQYSGPRKAFYFRGDPDTVEVLKRARVGLVSLANNHALDADPEGLRQTRQILGENGITPVGAGDNLTEASAMARYSLGDLRLGVLAYCDHQPDFAAGETSPGIRYLDLTGPEDREQILEDIRKAAPAVDHLIVSLRWQSNWEPRVREPFRELARAMMQAGADLVWGHSPHHIQGVEWFTPGPVIYGSGGLLDDYAVDAAMRNDLQVLYRARLDAGGIHAIQALPIKLELGRTSPAKGMERDTIRRRFEQFCRSLGSTVSDEGAWLTVAPGEA